MMPSESPDPELQEIRARRLRELLQRDQTKPVRVETHPEELTSQTWETFLREHPRAVLDVWAPWCAPCRALAPIFERLAREFAGQVAFAKVNSDEEPELAMRWQVQGIPTQLFFREGALVHRVVGLRPEPELRETLRRVFPSGGEDSQ